MKDASLVVDHRLAVNPATADAMPRLDREQLWRGLVLRMRCPDAFLPGLDECRIEQAAEDRSSEGCASGTRRYSTG